MNLRRETERDKNEKECNRKSTAILPDRDSKRRKLLQSKVNVFDDSHNGKGGGLTFCECYIVF